MKRVSKKYDFKKALVFTDDEFNLINAKSQKNWHVINKINYHGRNFVYVYLDNGGTYLFDIYKFEKYFIVEAVYQLGALYYGESIEEVLEFLEQVKIY
jgi:hypothetical protein